MPNEFEIRLLHEELVRQRRDAALILQSLMLLHRNINALRDEVKILATNDAQLTQVVTDIVADYAALSSAISAEIAALTAANENGDDAAQDTAIANLQALDVTIKANTAAAQAAIAPVVDPAPAGDSGQAAS